MKRQKIEVSWLGITVKVYTNKTVKNGKPYTSYQIADYSGGTRKVWTFADLRDAKSKAKEIAEAVAKGKPEVLRWEEGLRVEIRKALEVLEGTGFTIFPACNTFSQAVSILGNPNELLAACQYWKQHRPDKPITPKPAKEAVREFLGEREKRVGFKRHKTETSYLDAFVRAFGDRPLNEIGAADLTDFLNDQEWAAKTRNDALSAVALLFKEAQLRSWVGKDHNPAKQVRRFKEIRGPVEIFEPWEAKQILARLTIAAPELVPFFALWCFCGIRKEEIARMNWPQVNRGLVTGYIELPGRITKTGQPRTVPITDNLRAWLVLHRKDTGTTVPSYWLTATKSAQNRLDEINRFIARKTGIIWRDNAPRHSFATYHFKLHKDPGEVTSVMGTSLEKFQKHYWHKSRTVTLEAANEWFNIYPESRDNLVPMSCASSANISRPIASASPAATAAAVSVVGG